MDQRRGASLLKRSKSYRVGVFLYIAPIVGYLVTLWQMIRGLHGFAGESNGRPVELAESISLWMLPSQIAALLMVVGAILLFVSHVRCYRKQWLGAGETSRRDFVMAGVLCAFLGWLGIHRFYVGKHLSGVFYLLTFGGFIVGRYLDFLQLCRGEFIDADGKPVVFVEREQAEVANSWE